MTTPEINDPLRNNIKVNGNVGPVSGVDVPRFGGHTTFARLPRIEDVSKYDVAILGAPLMQEFHIDQVQDLVLHM